MVNFVLPGLLGQSGAHKYVLPRVVCISLAAVIIFLCMISEQNSSIMGGFM